MLILLDLRSLFHSAVSGISIADFIIFSKKIDGFSNVMDICCCSCNRMDITASGIHSGMNFHAVIPLVSLFRLVHLRITLAFPVLG